MQVGFYYKTFIRPRRRLAALREGPAERRRARASSTSEHRRTERYEKVHRHVDVLVIGGGEAGLEAATEAAAARPRHGAGRRGPRAGRPAGLRHAGGAARARRAGRRGPAAGVEILQPAYAGGVYEGLLVPVYQGTTMYRFRAGELVLATGSIEQPLVFGNNDLPGVMLGGGARRLLQPVPDRCPASRPWS